MIPLPGDGIGMTSSDGAEVHSRRELEEKEFALDLFKRQIAEEKRDRILERSHFAMRNLKSGKVKRGSVNDLFGDLADA
jgi:hypothetical protein